MSSNAKYRLSEPASQSHFITNALHITWYLEDEDHNGYFISWNEAAFDTHKPECMAFRMERGSVKYWDEIAVSYDPIPNTALKSVIGQLKEFDESVPEFDEIEYTDASDAEREVLL